MTNHVLPKVWAITVCPACNGRTTAGLSEHTSDCPNNGRQFIAQTVHVVPQTDDRVGELLHEALTDYATHASWRCEHPDRYPHEPECPCDYTAWARATRAALAGGGDLSPQGLELARLRFALQEIADQRIPETNPDGLDQAAHTMRLIALVALSTDAQEG